MNSLLREPLWVKTVLLGISGLFLLLFVFLPVLTIFQNAFTNGGDAYLYALSHEETLDAIRLTLVVAAIVVPLNTLFGLVASWACAKFSFPGKQVLISLIELPLSVSPVIAGLLFVLIFNIHTSLGEWLFAYDIQVLFAMPAIVLATLFVTFPYVARELIPLMQQLGSEEEEAARLLGASGLSTYFRITLPNIKWGVLYGVLLCSARSLGEFGAVSVVSGHIQGQTVTLPLHIGILYNEYQFAAAFAASSVLTFMAFITLVAKRALEGSSAEGEKRS